MYSSKRKNVFKLLAECSKIAVAWIPRKGRMAALLKSHFCAPLAMQALCSCFSVLLPTSVELWISQTRVSREIDVMKNWMHQESQHA